MRGRDPLFGLLCDFFNLPPEIRREDVSQSAIEAWDSLAMVQLIADLQGTFAVEFELDEIGTLRSYDEIRSVLKKKGLSLEAPLPHDEQQQTQ